MPSKPSRHRGASDNGSGVFPSSAETESQLYSPSRRSNMKKSGSRHSVRHERYSSGYGSLDESSDTTHISSRRSSTRPHKTETARYRSPPPRYGDVCEAPAPQYVQMPSQDQAYYSDFENSAVVESESNWSSGSQHFCSTVVEVPEGTEITHLKTTGRDALRYAPDMLLDNASHLVGGPPLQVRVNNESTEYELLSLASTTEAMEKLKLHAKKHFFMKPSAVKNCEVFATDASAVFRYSAMSMAEDRAIIQKTKPYTGKKLMTGNVQSPWDYEVDPPTRFADDSESYILPNTEKSKSCEKCGGSTKAKCKECNGLGSKTCERCHGSGEELMTHGRDCFECNGGFQTCDKCHGSGSAKCDDCQGKGRVIEYSVLKATWRVQRDVYIDQLYEVPAKQLRSAQGKRVFSECRKKLGPITEENMLHENIRQHSRYCLKKQRRMCGKILKQKQVVDVIPVQAIYCHYKDKSFRFFVIGQERKIYAPDCPKNKFSAVAKLFSRR